MCSQINWRSRRPNIQTRSDFRCVCSCNSNQNELDLVFFPRTKYPHNASPKRRFIIRVSFPVSPVLRRTRSHSVPLTPPSSRLKFIVKGEINLSHSWRKRMAKISRKNEKLTKKKTGKLIHTHAHMPSYRSEDDQRFRWVQETKEKTTMPIFMAFLLPWLGDTLCKIKILNLLNLFSAI